MRKSIFHENWWLDSLAPGRWREVSCRRGGRVVGTLRFVERSQAGMKICEMPHVTRILGPVVTPETQKTEAYNRSAHSIVSELLEQVAGHDHVEMSLDPGFSDLTPFLHAGFEVKIHPTLHLDCSARSETLWAGLRDKVRNSVRRARERLAVRDIADADRFVSFYKSNLGPEGSYFDMSSLTTVLNAARTHQQCRIVAAEDPRGVTHAMAVFIWDDAFAYYFLSSRRRDVAHNGAVSLLLWSGIELAQSRGLRFDFDGGVMKPSRYDFLNAFGGTLANRFDISRSTPLFRVQHALRRIPQALVRKVAKLSVQPSQMKVLLAICWAQMIAWCWRVGNSAQIGECLV
jgi:hypothetical protein